MNKRRGRKRDCKASTLQIRLKVEDLQQIKDAAARNRLSLSAYTRMTLFRAIEREAAP